MRAFGVAFFVATLAATCALGAAADSESQDLTRVTEGFYGAYLTLHPSDGIPDGPTRAKFAPFVSPALNALFVAGEDAEARYAKATKNQSPPLVEGDLFTPNFEGATSFKIGACKAEGTRGRCAATLTYDDRKDAPLVWTDTIYLVRTEAGWRIDDIGYGGNWDFGNKGRMTDVLKDAIRDGNTFSGQDAK